MPAAGGLAAGRGRKLPWPGRRPCLGCEAMSLRIAVIEDDPPTSSQLAGWLRAARPDAQIDCWLTRDAAESALAAFEKAAQAAFSAAGAMRSAASGIR